MAPTAAVDAVDLFRDEFLVRFDHGTLRATPTSESRRPRLAGCRGLLMVLVRARPLRARVVACVSGEKCQMCSVGFSVHQWVRNRRAGSDANDGVEKTSTPLSARR